MRALILLVLVFTAVHAQAADEWTKEDTERQLLYTALHMIDWGQTRHIARHPEKFKELNPVLGDHPSVTEVDLYFTSSIAAMWFISYKLNKKNRKAFQWFITGIAMQAVGNNLAVGIGYRW